MKVTNTVDAVLRTPTLTPLGQPEEWQPGETRDLPEALARALATSGAFTLVEETVAPAQPTPVEPGPEPTPAPVAPPAGASAFASADAPTQPTL